MAYEASRFGRSVIVIDRGRIGRGMTARTTAYLATELDDFYSELVRVRGEDDARIYYQSQVAAVNRIKAMGEFAHGQGGVVRNLAEYLTPGEIDSADELKPGEGGILREGIAKIAVYRTADGKLVRRSAVCTHVGCIVQWNSFERCWDCPCHGSQFAPDGDVLNGAAVRPLAKAKPADPKGSFAQRQLGALAGRPPGEPFLAGNRQSSAAGETTLPRCVREAGEES